MKRTLAAGAAGIALVLPLSLATAVPASAAPNKNANCVAKGVTTLAALGASQAAAAGTLDYSPFGLNGTGDIRLPLETGTTLPLKTVIGLHRTDPQLFSWCDR
jgi:hypothetical protein